MSRNPEPPGWGPSPPQSPTDHGRRSIQTERQYLPGAPQPPRPPQPRPQPTPSRSIIGVAAATLALGVVLGGVGVYFLGPDRSSPEAEAVAQLGDQVNDAVNSAVTGGAAGTPEPKTEEGVRAGVQEWGDRYAAGDYGGSWDLWVAAAKREFSRDDYVRLHELCPDAGAGIRFSIDAVDYQPGADVATARITRLIATFTYELHYQDGGWKVMPTDENIADYRQYATGEALAQARQAEGTCGES